MINNLTTYEVITIGKLIIVTSTGGHITELDVSEKKYSTLYGAKIEKGKLEIVFKKIEEKENIINTLRLLAQDVDYVLVATDPDAEGEKIAWDIMAIIKPFNSNIKRIKYHEVTKKAIEKALSNPEEFNPNLLKAQIFRRVEDAWIGLTLSTIVQKKFRKALLSAGRV